MHSFEEGVIFNNFEFSLLVNLSIINGSQDDPHLTKMKSNVSEVSNV